MELVERRRVSENNVTPLRSRSAHQTVVSRVDQPLLYVTLVLVAFGLVAVYTASANQALHETGSSATILLKQLIAAVLGLFAMGAISRVNFQVWRRLANPMGIVAIALLLMTMVAGTTANGSERWLPLPFGFQFQPSDFAKVAAITLLAQATSHLNRFSTVMIKNLMLVGLMVALVYQQPNLSVSMILGAVTLMMLFIGRWPLIFFAVVLPVGAAYISHKVQHTEYQWRRITGWLDPWKDPQDTGYNLIQSYYAIGNGGILGVGLGHSVQKLYYLPFQHTDFIFSVICEELGLFGALIVMGLFGLLAWRGFSIALACQSRFGQMLAFGLTASILLQAMINISVTIGLMPVTGVTLPLISYGGTSMIITLCMIGILLNISRYRLSPRALDV